jgi:uncharacterized protein YggL (DUF469 family)
MKKLLYVTLTVGLIASLAVPTFADNNGNGKGNGSSNANANGSTWKTKTELKVNEKLELKIHENTYIGDDEDEDDADDSQYYGLPYGLFKKEVLPYGLSKRDDLPFGLSKQLDAYWDGDLTNADAEALIEKTEALIETAEDTYDAFEDSDYTDELEALEEAIDDAEAAIDDLNDAIDNAEEGETVSTDALADAFKALRTAVAAFSDLEVVDDDAVEALETQIDDVEEVLNGSVFGEVQGVYPTDSDEALLDYIDEIETAIDSGLTYSEYLTYSRNLTKLLDIFLDSKYATDDEIVDYNDDVDAYQEEVTAWLADGEVEDTEISVISAAFYDYYKIVMLTPTFDEDALVSAAALDKRIQTIEDARDALLAE